MLALKMQDEQPLYRFSKIVNAGAVYGPYGPYKSDRTAHMTYAWHARGEAAAEALRALAPYLGSNCLRRIELGLSALNSH